MKLNCHSLQNKNIVSPWKQTANQGHGDTSLVVQHVIVTYSKKNSKPKYQGDEYSNSNVLKIPQN
jgi:hypothetical protein